MIATLLLLAGCAEMREQPDDIQEWYDAGQDLDVAEAIEFTDVPYDFPADAADGLGAFSDTVFPAPDFTILYAQGDEFGTSGGALANDCETAFEAALPREFDVIVTLHPRYYFKTSGCGGESDEKYYGSYFVQDATGGLFVLGDSRVAHFDVGDRVRIRVRGVRTAFDQDMIYAHDIVSVERNARQPIYYEAVSGRALSAQDVGMVRRVEGVVNAPKDTFGEFTVEGDDGQEYSVSLDVELNRRGVEYPVGARVQVTAPILYSYGLYSLVVMEIGQITVLE